MTSGGTLSLELACVGIPQLVIVQAETHWPTAQRLEDEGAAVCLGIADKIEPPDAVTDAATFSLWQLRRQNRSATTAAG